MSYNEQYHIKLTEEHSARYAILPGDPGRVEKIAALLDEPRQLCYNREYNSYLGYLCGERVLVVSTGIGAPSAAICIEELAKIGVECFIRVGTCGGMQPTVAPGDLVVATGAIRSDGTSREYMPIEFPAVADFNVTSAICSAARKLGYNYHAGVVQAKDSFYCQHSPESAPNSAELLQKWYAWKRGGCLASEMESGILFILGSVRRLRTGAVFHCVWNQETEKSAMPKNRNTNTNAAIETAIEALRIIIESDKKRLP